MTRAELIRRRVDCMRNIQSLDGDLVIVENEAEIRWLDEQLAATPPDVERPPIAARHARAGRRKWAPD